MSAQTNNQRSVICPGCRTENQAGSRFCTKCGAAIGGQVDKPLPDPRVESLLASANLSRLRGDWQAAEARCIEILKSDPNNVHAHSLLGDLYRGQNRLDDASQWYRLAIDLDPGSRADRMKLETVLTEIARRQARSGPLGGTVPGGTQKLMGIAPVNWVWGLTAISVVFAVLVLGIVIAMRGKSNQPDIKGTIEGPAVNRTGNPGSVGSPLPMPDKPTVDQTAPAANQTPKITTPPAARPITPTPGATQAESAIQQALSQANLGSDVSVGPVTMDPRQGSANLILTINNQTNAEDVRNRLPVIAVNAARAAFTHNTAIQAVSVNLRASTATGVQAVFTGDLDRRAAEQADPSASPADLARIFNDAWFAPQYAPVLDNPKAPGT